MKYSGMLNREQACDLIADLQDITHSRGIVYQVGVFFDAHTAGEEWLEKKGIDDEFLEECLSVGNTCLVVITTLPAVTHVTMQDEKGRISVQPTRAWCNWEDAVSLYDLDEWEVEFQPCHADDRCDWCNESKTGL